MKIVLASVPANIARWVFHCTQNTLLINCIKCQLTRRDNDNATAAAESPPEGSGVERAHSISRGTNPASGGVEHGIGDGGAVVLLHRRHHGLEMFDPYRRLQLLSDAVSCLCILFII